MATRSDRRAYLVCYDVGDDKRRAVIHKTMRAFGEWMQYSVFLCVLSASRFVRLRTELEETIQRGEDHVLIVPLGSPESGRINQILSLGKALQLPAEGPKVF